MKKISILICLISHCVIATSQDLTTNKEETIALLSNHFNKTNGLILKYKEGDYTLKDCKLSYERGWITISQTVYKNSSDYRIDTYQFCPLFIEGIDDASDDSKREPEDLVGSIRIFNPDYKVFWEKQSSSENKEVISWHNSTISINTYYDGEKNANKIRKGLLRLQQILKSEKNPFENTPEEKSLIELYSKYKVFEATARPSGTKVKVENMQFTPAGPIVSYTCKKTTIGQEPYYNDEGGVSTQLVTTTNLLGGEFWWRNLISLKYNVKFGSLILKTTAGNLIYRGAKTSSSGVSDLKGSEMTIFFKPAIGDTNDDTKKDVLEFISTIKKIVKLYGGGEVKVEINEL